MSKAIAADTPSRWLYGPVRDLVFGCGLGYAVIFVLQSLGGAQMRSVLPLALGPLVALVVSVPHYGATLLRVYEHRRERRKYAVFAVWFTLLVAVFFVAGLSVPLLGCWMITVYLTWSPWHYTGQNYGVALMLMGRRGVKITPRAKRLFKWSFWLSFGLAVLAIHGPNPVADYQPTGLGGGEYRFLPLGIPSGIRDALLVVLGGAYAVVTVASLWLFARGGRVRDLGPAIVMVATQAMWFSVPALVRRWDVLAGIEPLSTREIPYSFLWVAVGHAVQYLWVTAFYARRENPSLSHARFFGKTTAAGMVIWTLPALAFAPGLLGDVPFDAGLALMVASGVNIHHFILDGAIWKLRGGRVARILIRDVGPEEPDEPEQGSGAARKWGLRVTGVLGAVFFCVAAAAVLEEHFGFSRSVEAKAPDVARAGQAIERLRWFGRDSARMRSRLGLAAASQGDVELAEQSFRKALDLHPSALAWTGLGAVHAERSEWGDAEKAYDAALALDPEYPMALLWAGQLQLQLGNLDAARRSAQKAWESAAGYPQLSDKERADIRGAATALLQRMGGR